MSRTKPLILSTALTGVRFSPWRKDPETGKSLPIASTKLAKNMPVTPSEIEQAAENSYNNGARFIHVHARNPETGEQFADLAYYMDITQRIRHTCPGAIISYPTSRKGEVEQQIEQKRRKFEGKLDRPLNPGEQARLEAAIRPIGMEACPDTITSFTVPEMKMFGELKNAVGVENVSGWTDPKIMQQYYQTTIDRAAELGVNQEIEVQTLGQFEVMRKVFDFGGMNGPMHLVLLPGFSNGFQITRKDYEIALKSVEDFQSYTQLPVTVTCGAVIVPPMAKASRHDLSNNKHDYREVFNWIAEDNRVDVFRTGIEDTPVLYGRDQTNEDLVKHAAYLCNVFDIPIETDPNIVRDRFGFPHDPPETLSRAGVIFNNVLSDITKAIGWDDKSLLQKTIGYNR